MGRLLGSLSNAISSLASSSAVSSGYNNRQHSTEHGKMHKMLLESCNAMVRHLFPFRSKAKMHLGYEIQGAVSQKSSMSGHVHSIRVGFVLGTMSNNFDFSMTVLRGLLVQVKNRD